MLSKSLPHRCRKGAVYLLTVALFSACSSVEHVPGPILNGTNFKVLKASASSNQYGFKFLGLFPIVSPNIAKAEKEIYAAAGENLEGRSITLANRTEERTGVYLVLFSVPRLTVTADVVEFVKE